jgi:hypothetical protein
VALGYGYLGHGPVPAIHEPRHARSRPETKVPLSMHEPIQSMELLHSAGQIGSPIGVVHKNPLGRNAHFLSLPDAVRVIGADLTRTFCASRQLEVMPLS